MFPYILLLMVSVWLALTHMRPHSVLSIPPLSIKWFFVIVVLTIMIGFRYEVGGDWIAYLMHVDNMKGEPLDAIVGINEPAFQLLNWLGANVGGGIYFVNLICAALFSWGLVIFCSIQPRPWLALLVAVPFLVTVVSMGFTRQGVAVGLAMLAFTRLELLNVSRFMFWIVLAALFHKSAVILIPLAVLVASRSRVLTVVSVAVASAVLFVVLLQEQLDYFARNYIEAEHTSSGAGIRILMNAIPAALLLLFRKRFELSPHTRKIWLWMAWGALLFIPIYFVSPSSSAVDRVALYWIPMQMLILSRLPDAFGLRGRRNPLWVILVAVYCASVMLVWLLFADHAYLWIPYRFYPWVALWQ
jgi:hypothetical protein